MAKNYKVWIEVEEHDDKTDTYTKIGESVDLFVKNQKAAFKLQLTLHECGEAMQTHLTEIESSLEQ